jgi:hypothetical protein
MKMEGWLLDASVDRRNRALTLWIKVGKKTRGYTYNKFHPSVFVRTDLLDDPKWSDTGALKTVLEHPDVTGTAIVHKFVSVYDEQPKRVLQVFTTPDMHWKVARDLETLPGATVFHSDLNPVQQFFITIAERMSSMKLPNWKRWGLKPSLTHRASSQQWRTQYITSMSITEAN